MIIYLFLSESSGYQMIINQPIIKDSKANSITYQILKNINQQLPNIK